jgi:hypothetical protein
VSLLTRGYIPSEICKLRKDIYFCPLYNTPHTSEIEPICMITPQMLDEANHVTSFQTVVSRLVSGGQKYAVDRRQCPQCHGPFHEGRTEIFTIDSPILICNIAPGISNRLNFPQILIVGDDSYKLISRTVATAANGGHFVSVSRYPDHVRFHDSMKDNSSGFAVACDPSRLEGAHDLTCFVYYVKQ